MVNVGQGSRRQEFCKLVEPDILADLNEVTVQRLGAGHLANHLGGSVP